MNILGTCRHLLSYLSMGASPAKSEAEPAADNDNDGPAPGGYPGGGYNDSVNLSDVESSSKKGPETVSPSDGPGAGGGYDDADTDSDGPGAGGGYNPSVSDGPGAGGGYDLLSDYDGPGAGGGYFNSTNFLGQQWLMGPPAPKAANSNKKPAAKTNEGKAE